MTPFAVIEIVSWYSLIWLHNAKPSAFKDDDNCQLSKKYTYVNINLVQICIAVSICLLCMIVICALLLTDSLDNVPAVSQIRDLMCSSIGFLLGEYKKNKFI